MSDYEIVDSVPRKAVRGKWQKDWEELATLLLKVPPGKSVRRPFLEKAKRSSFGAAVRAYVKRQKLDETYFIAEPKEAVDGCYYVYVGRRQA